MRSTLFIQLAGYAYVARVAAGAPPSECVKVLQENDKLQNIALLETWGKSLPNDAGKYGMCMDAPGVRYFLVSAKSQVLPVPINLGGCMPSVCSNEDVSNLVQGKTGPLSVIDPALQIKLRDVTSKSPQIDLQAAGFGTTAALAVLCFMVLLVACSTHLVGIGTSVVRVELPAPAGCGGAQQFVEPEAEPVRGRLGSMPLAKAFSLFGESGTLKKLLESPPYKPTDCLNGLRVLSMAWIILGHTFLMPEGISGYSNPEDIQMSNVNPHAAERSPLIMIILSSQASVDTFFFLSAFLLSYLTLKELRRGAERATIASRLRFVIQAVVMRYLRLTPSLAAALVFYYKILAFMGNGPFSPKFQDSILSKCDASWWSELTYTMNFIPFDSDQVCMGWTWYLGDDIIFFITGMIILPLYNWQKWVGWLSVITLAGFSCVVGTWLIVKYNLGCYVFDYHYAQLSYYEYSKPYTRFPAYAVGIVTAWLLDELEQRGITRDYADNARVCTRLAAKALAACVFGTLAFLVFIPHTDFGFHKNSWGNVENVLNLVFARILWAACWGAITLLCYYGFLPLTDGFLSHRVWTPLARLTYGAYLLHPLAIKLAAGRSYQFYNFGGFNIFYRFLGNSTIAFGGAVALWALVERPMLTLTTAARKKKTSREARVAASEGTAPLVLAASPASGAGCSRT